MKSKKFWYYIVPVATFLYAAWKLITDTGNSETTYLVTIISGAWIIALLLLHLNYELSQEKKDDAHFQLTCDLLLKNNGTTIPWETYVQESFKIYKDPKIAAQAMQKQLAKSFYHCNCVYKNSTFTFDNNTLTITFLKEKTGWKIIESKLKRK